MNTNSQESAHWTVTNTQPRIAIIGCGVSGISAVVHLRKAGYTDITVFEKAGSVGGTWRENKYPGLSCDIASYWYSFTFAPNSNWSHRYPLGPEIREYLESVAEDFGVNAITRFNTEVTELKYSAPVWHLQTREGELSTFDIVISASGVLHHPKVPDIPGLDTFEGRWVHSTDWDDSLEIDGANVAVIGTGSTSAQIVGALGERAQKLDVYQRTPQWMFPLFQHRYSSAWKWVMSNVPGMHKIMYWLHRQLLERTLGPATMGNDRWQHFFQWMCTRQLHQTVKDPSLRAKLTPDYKATCKRLVICSSFFKSIIRDNVELVTEAIEGIEAQGVRTADGQLRKADTLVLCTGFHTDRYLLPVDVTGVDGKTLAGQWAGAPRAHRATSVPSFPNLWFIQGPTGPVGNISLVAVSEVQIKFIIQCLDKMKKDNLAVMGSSAAAYQHFNDELKRSVQKTTWATGGCQSWYIDGSGDPNLYSHPPRQFYRDMKHPNFSEFIVESANLKNEVIAQ